MDTAAPRKAQLLIRHLRGEHLLAEEKRSLQVDSRDVSIKTHPDASHIGCSLRVASRAIDTVRFAVECGSAIEPIRTYFIVIGAMKAGTTSLFELLAQHPAMCRTLCHVPAKSFPKEINYFRKLYRKGHTPLHYDWRFPFDSSKHAWTLDVSPGYAKWPGSRAVPGRIDSLGGRVKLAYILRDPVDRIESHLAHHHRTGETTTMRHCVRTSRYAMQLDRYMEHFAREDILLLDFDQLRRNPAAIMAQVCEFLSVETFPAKSKVHNKRGVEFRLDPERRAELAKVLRPDVRRLINLYGFEPAEGWLAAAN